MTLQERQQVYEELGEMFVEIDLTPERGLTYVKERIGFCRAMQDRVGELLLRASRAYAERLEERLRAEQLYQIDPQAIQKGQISEMKVEEQAHKLLIAMVKAQATLLSRTGADLRLLADITKEQIKRGEIDPSESPALTKTVEPSEALPAIRQAGLPVAPVTSVGTREEGGAAGPAPEAPTAPAAAAVSLDEFSAVLSGSNGSHPDAFGGEDVPSSPRPETMEAISEVLASSPRPAVALVDLNNDQTSPEPYEPMRLPDTSAVSFDDLFQEPVNGQPSTPRIF